MNCPAFTTLERYARDALEDGPGADLGRHVGGCESCAALLDDIRANERALAELNQWVPASAQPERIGPFRVIGEVGRGGMGVVLRAEQDQPRRSVALKLVRPARVTRETLRRFRIEVEALGRLDHPNIARIFSAGVAEVRGERQPYFAMELVHGRRLDVLIAAAPPPRPERLRIFLELCDGIAYAHRAGVLHRDLKPSNVLVDECGHPRIIDFGLAQMNELEGASTAHTESGRLMGTLPFMAPELATAGVRAADARADVYGLGAILYVLLCGRTPLQLEGLPLVRAIRAIEETWPAPPSSVDESVPRPLDWIVRRALEKDPRRRYGTVDALADDVRRFLDDEPLVAGPTTLRYRLGLLARRHRVATALLVSVVLGLTVAVAGLGYGLERERDALALAKEEAEAREWLGEQLTELVSYADPAVSRGKDVSLRDALDGLRAEIIARSDAPVVRASLLIQLGTNLRRIGRISDAERALSTAQRLLVEHGTKDEDVLDDVRVELAQLDLDTGRSGQARKLLEQVGSGFERRLGPDHPRAQRVRYLVARCCLEDGQYEKAERLLGKELPPITTAAGGDEDSAAWFAAYATMRFRRGDVDGATRALDRTNRFVEEHPFHPNALGALGLRGHIALYSGDFGAAGRALCRAADGMNRIFEPTHPARIELLGAMVKYEVLRGERARADANLAELNALLPLVASSRMSSRFRSELARIFLSAGDLDVASELGPTFDEASRTTGPILWEYAGEMGNACRDRGDLEAAERWLRFSYERARRYHPPSDPVVLSVMSNLVGLLDARSKIDDAIAITDPYLKDVEGEGLCDAQWEAVMWRTQFARKSHDDAAAARLVDRAIEIALPLGRIDDPRYADLLHNQALYLSLAGESRKAEPLLERLVESRIEAPGPESEKFLSALNGLARCYAARGRVADAEACFRELVYSSETALGRDHRDVAYYHVRYADFLADLQRYDEAEPQARRALESAVNEDDRGLAREILAKIARRDD